MAVVKIKQFLGNCKDPALRRALRAILEQMRADMAANVITYAAYANCRVLGPAPVFAAKATADPDIKTTNNFAYVKSDGSVATQAAGNIDVSAIAGYTPTVLAAGYQRYYLITMTIAAGTYGCTEGASHASAAVLPAPPAGTMAVGWVKVVNTTNPFTFGTTNTDAAGVTATYGDLSGYVAANALVNNIQP